MPVAIVTREETMAGFDGSGKAKDGQWLELYGGPGDGVKCIRSKFPVTLKFPDNFAVENQRLAALPTTLYKRWERVHTLVESETGKPMIVSAMIYYPDGTNEPSHRRLTYDKYKRKA